MQSQSLVLMCALMSGCVLKTSGQGNVPGAPAATTTPGSSGGSSVIANDPTAPPPGPTTPLTTLTTVTAVDGSTIQTVLPMLPSMTNVTGRLGEDTVSIDFDPVDGAIDYRVYALPADDQVSATGDGTIVIDNGTYRCAGRRQAMDNKNTQNKDDSTLDPPNGQYAPVSTVAADPSTQILGYVFTTPASDRTAVYAAAGFPMTAESGWQEARLKVYTTDPASQQTRLGQGWRDDGIVFYVPAAASAATHTLYGSQTAQLVAGQGWTQRYQYYFNADQMSAHAHDTTPPSVAFETLAAAAPGSEPLYGTLLAGSQNHVELSVGPERFHRAAYQGDGPLWHVEWSGITAPTTLVVEALDSGCPFQGFLSPNHLEAPPHQTFFTLDELRANAQPTAEVFINGQYDTPTARPKAIARAFLKVVPQPHDASAWDWYQGFSTDFGTPTQIPGCTDGQDCNHWQTPAFDITSYRIDHPNDISVVTFGQMLGQLWEAFDDSGSDVTGKMRFTARTNGTIDADASKFLHATMTVNIVTTDRRYPQLIISDQPAPVQEGFKNPNNNSVLLQPIMGPSMRVEIQAFHGLVAGLVGYWDVNNQAPEHRIMDDDAWPYEAPQPPFDQPFEHAGVDRMTKFDLYLSTERAYVFMDDKPAGCTLLPDDVKFSGSVTVTYGDVLYHEGAPDEYVCAYAKPFDFLHEHQCVETVRHFDDLAFKSGVTAPTWDDANFPCLPY